MNASTSLQNIAASPPACSQLVIPNAVRNPLLQFGYHTCDKIVQSHKRAARFLVLAVLAIPAILAVNKVQSATAGTNTYGFMGRTT